MFTEAKHKVAKRDTLITIAKKYKHKSWKTIWDDKRNAKVKKKRGNPEAIEPGDVLIIPFNEDQLKALKLKAISLMSLMEAEATLSAALEKRADAKDHAAKLTRKRHKTVDKDYKDTIAMLESCRKDSKKWKDGVDVTYKVVKVLRDLKGMAKTAKSASKASGDELAALNKKMKTDAVGMITGPVLDAAKDAGIKYLTDESNEISEIGKTVGHISKWWGDLETPSFWAGAITRFSEKGDWSINGWQDAFQHDLDVDIDSKIHVVDKQRIFATKKLLRDAQAAEAEAKKLRKLADSAQKRMKAWEKELTALP
ncbi:MAG: LysM peptidoglycan-binding domain-containing protein [Pseudomonadota bacterium]